MNQNLRKSNQRQGPSRRMIGGGAATGTDQQYCNCTPGDGDAGLKPMKYVAISLVTGYAAAKLGFHFFMALLRA
jgi:hypothetical protein